MRFLLFFVSMFAFSSWASSFNKIGLDYYPDSERYNARTLPEKNLNKENIKLYKQYYLQSIYSFGELFQDNITQEKYTKEYNKSILSDIFISSKYNFDINKISIPECQSHLCAFPAYYFKTLKNCLSMYKQKQNIRMIDDYIKASAEKQYLSLQELKKAYLSSIDGFHPDILSNDKLEYYQKQSIELSGYKSRDIYFRALTSNSRPAYLYYIDKKIPDYDYRISQLLYKDNLQGFMTKLKDNYYKDIFSSNNDFSQTFSLLSH